MEGKVTCDTCESKFKNKRSLSSHKVKYHKATDVSDQSKKHEVETAKDLFLIDKDNIIDGIESSIRKQEEMTQEILRTFDAMERDRNQMTFVEKGCIARLVDGVYGQSKIIRSLLTLIKEIS